MDPAQLQNMGGGFTENKRLYYLDVLRVIACLCVIMIHTTGTIVTKDFGSVNFWIGNIFNSLARVGVPLFVMISGSIFLDENYNCTTDKLIRHIKKIVIFFVFWSLCYSLFNSLLIPLINHTGISLTSLLRNALVGHYHLWFCYMIFGIYLIVPLLRLWVKKENIKHVRYFLILALIFTMFIPSVIKYISLLCPPFENLNTIISYLNLNYVGGYTAYFILGWYLNNCDIRHEKVLVLLGIMSVAISAVGTAILSITLNEAHQAYGSLSAHVALQAMMVYTLIKKKYISTTGGGRSAKVISFIAKHSLGIYAIHAFFVDISLLFLAKSGISSALICIPVVFLISFVFSLFFSFIISKIPLLKKVV